MAKLCRSMNVSFRARAATSLSLPGAPPFRGMTAAEALAQRGVPNRGDRCRDAQAVSIQRRS